VAPGRCADLVIIPEPSTIRADIVISNGRVIAENGNPVVAPRKHRFSESSVNSIAIPEALTPSDFKVAAPNDAAGPVNVRCIEMVTDLVTRQLQIEMPVVDGELRSNPEGNIIKVAAIDRRHTPGKRFVGFIRGYGMQAGAMAASGAWDTSDIIVVGADDSDMADAVNRIRQTQGGIVAVKNGQILTELPLPIFGVMSDLPMREIAERTRQLKAVGAELGITFPDPALTLLTLTGAAIPYLRICEEGYVDLKDGRTLGLFD